MTEAQQDSQVKLIESARRLVVLLDLEAPGQIVCDEIAQILTRAVMAYGDLAFARVGASVRRAKLIANGYCPECERRFERGAAAEESSYPDHCPECREQLERTHWAPEMN